MTDQERIEKCRELWVENKKENITNEELIQKLAYISLGHIDDYRFLLSPTAPEAVQIYHTKSKEEKEKATKDGFWVEPEHSTWLQQELAVWGRNRSNLAYLLTLKKSIRAEDQLPLKKVLNSYRDFTRKETVRARMLGSEEKQEELKSQETIEELTEEAISAVTIFDGQEAI